MRKNCYAISKSRASQFQVQPVKRSCLNSDIHRQYGRQIILLFVTLLAAIAGATPAGAALSVGDPAGSFLNGAGSFVQCFMTVKVSTPLWEKF